MSNIEIICTNCNTRKKYPLGTTLKEISLDLNIELKYPVLGAFVNNKLKELSYSIYKPKTVEFIDITHPDGMRMYIRSLSFVLQKAVKEVLPGKRLKVEHAISKGYYCEVEGLRKALSVDGVYEVMKRMREIVEENIPFEREEVLSSEAITLFKECGLDEKVILLESRPKMYRSVYTLGDIKGYFYGHLVPSSGYLQVFDLIKYYDGMLLRVPKSSNPDECEEVLIQNKLFEIFQEYKEWGDILDVGYIGNINKLVKDKKVSDLIQVSEALQEKKLVYIADTISQKDKLPKLILIAGPSSSGKTTFAQRLAVQLKVAGVKPVTLSLDNYFVDRELTPKDENGEYDFEALGALDLDLLNDNLLRLIDGDRVEIPKFSFQTGKRYYDGDFLQIDEKTVIVAEGIHALNPELTSKILDADKFRIYVSALTTVSIDNHNRIPTTDTRLIRRIVRDYRYRGYSALDTINRWQSVRRGEEKHIFPYQENADVMFNTAVHYEAGVLKKYVEPILYEVSPVEEAYREANRLLKFLSYVEPVPDKEIPPTSILREFLGGSSFKY